MSKRKRGDECLDLYQQSRELFETGRFSDFEIIAGDTTFKVHRPILVRSSYFDAALNAGLSESKTGKICLPESLELVTIIIKFLYGHKDNDLKEAIDSLLITSIVALYGAADKYMLWPLKSLALQGWTKRFENTLSATGVEDTAGFINALKVVKTTELDMSPFADSIADSLGKRYSFELSHANRRDAFAANPKLFLGFLKNKGLIEMARTVPNRTYPARCPSCDKGWHWPKDKFDQVAELFCPHCGVKHLWMEYYARYTIV